MCGNSSRQNSGQSSRVKLANARTDERGRKKRLTDVWLGKVADSNQNESEHQEWSSGGNAHQGEGVCNPAVVDRESWLGRVDLVTANGVGSGEFVTLGGDDVVATVGVLSETPLLL